LATGSLEALTQKRLSMKATINHNRKFAINSDFLGQSTTLNQRCGTSTPYGLFIASAYQGIGQTSNISNGPFTLKNNSARDTAQVFPPFLNGIATLHGVLVSLIQLGVPHASSPDRFTWLFQ
jgi:hypothetical protein